MDTKTKALIAEVKEKGYVVSKPKEKSIARELMNAAYGGAADQMIKDEVPDLTVRKICMKAIEDKFFDTCLDTLFKGKNKRAAFDNQSPKSWSKRFEATSTVTKDIKTKGQYKRWKLIERHIKMDMNLTKTLLDPDYRPAGDKVVVKKRKYEKKK